MKCPKCSDDAKIVRTMSTTIASKTFLGKDKKFHVHDTNRKTASCVCQNGHEWTEEWIGGCPVDGCDFNKANHRSVIWKSW